MRTSCGLTERCARNVPVFAAVERLRVISLVIKKEGARNVAPLSRISNGYPHSLSQASSLKQDARDDWIPEQLTLRGRCPSMRDAARPCHRYDRRWIGATGRCLRGDGHVRRAWFRQTVLA